MGRRAGTVIFFSVGLLDCCPTGKILAGSSLANKTAECSAIQNGEAVLTALIIPLARFSRMLARVIPLFVVLPFGRTLVGRTLPNFPKQPAARRRFRLERRGWSKNRPFPFWSRGSMSSATDSWGLRHLGSCPVPARSPIRPLGAYLSRAGHCYDPAGVPFSNSCKKR